MNKHAKLTGILGKRRLEFKDSADLERYYEDKYAQGGYEGEGCSIRGLDISRLYHQARHASAIRFLEPSSSDTILDAGCGDGSLSARLAPRCRRLCAIDIAGNAMSAAQHTAANIEFRKMNLEALDYPDRHFDKIVCVETLEHLLNPRQALNEFSRTLKVDGLLVLTYPTVNETAVKHLQERLGVGKRLEISEHLTEWSYDELVRHVAASGLEFLKSEGIVFDFGPLARLKYTSKTLARGITNLALSIRSFPRNSSFVSAAFRKTT